MEDLKERREKVENELLAEIQLMISSGVSDAQDRYQNAKSLTRHLVRTEASLQYEDARDLSFYLGLAQELC